MSAAGLTGARSRATAWFGAMAALTLIVAAAVALLAPASWGGLVNQEQTTDGSVALVAAVWLYNFVLAAAPALAGAAAVVARRDGHRRLGFAVLVAATLLQIRHPLAVGVVGGLDPVWLLEAAPWWLLEFAAVTVVCAAAWRAWEIPDTPAGGRVLTRALLVAGVLLAIAAIVEVALT